MIHAWNILKHSVRQVFGNLGGALRVSGVLYLVQMVIALTLLDPVLQDQVAMQTAMKAGSFPWGDFALVLLLSTVCGLWIAVGWHRYVLIMEQPGMVPTFQGRRMLAYLGAGLLLGLVIGLVSLLAVFVIAIVTGVMDAGIGRVTSGSGIAALIIVSFAAVFALIAAIMTVFYRLSPMLPAAALGLPMSFGKAWDATKGAGGTLFVVSFGLLVVIMAIDYGVSGALGSLPILQLAWTVVWSWATLMIGVSVLTTIYGHYVEKRPLV